MCAKTMLNMEKTQVKMSDFIPNAVSLLRVKLCYNFTKKCMESTASKLFIKRCIWLKLEAKDAFFRKKKGSLQAGSLVRDAI